MLNFILIIAVILFFAAGYFVICELQKIGRNIDMISHMDIENDTAKANDSDKKKPVNNTFAVTEKKIS